MGCVHSTLGPRVIRSDNAEPTYDLGTRLAVSLEQCVPAANKAKKVFSEQPVGWNVFADERERQHFIRSTIIVVSDNGARDVDDQSVEILIPKDIKYLAQMVVHRRSGVVSHTITARKSATEQRQAFVFLQREIERQLLIILKRSQRTVASDIPDEPPMRQVHKTQSRQSIQSPKQPTKQASRQSLQTRQPNKRASRQSLQQKQFPPTKLTRQQIRAAFANGATRDEVREMLDQLPPSERTIFWKEITPCQADIAAKRAAQGLIPPINSEAWNETRLPNPRNDSMEPSLLPKLPPTQRLLSNTPYPNTSQVTLPTSPRQRYAMTTTIPPHAMGTSTIHQHTMGTTTIPQTQIQYPYPMIARAGRCGTGEGRTVEHFRQQQKTFHQYELSYYGKEDLMSPTTGGGMMGGSPATDGGSGSSRRAVRFQTQGRGRGEGSGSSDSFGRWARRVTNRYNPEAGDRVK